MGTTMFAFSMVFLLSTSPCILGNMQLAPALYVFGDSTVDGGNTNTPNTVYGIDLNCTAVPPRWTNGLNIADFIATFLGLPLVPPYLNMLEAGKSISDVNYGSAGCGRTGSLLRCWTFDKQLECFNSTIYNNLKKSVTQEQLLHHLGQSVFLVSFGIYDYNQNYLQPNNGTLRKLMPDLFAQFLLNELCARLTTLYLMGARKFLINNIWPLGCSPGYILNQSEQSASCDEHINKKLFPYNDTLPVVLKKLQDELHGSIFSCSDNFEFVYDLKRNPAQYGIMNTTGGCLSESLGGTPCDNRNQYLYYDVIHTTQAANSVFALNCFNGSICSPNIIQLVGA